MWCEQWEPFRMEGHSVILEELTPKYFSQIIRWRNDEELHRYLNQHFNLTEEKERDWYENIYMKDNTQGLFIMIDKASGTPFGTNGYTDYDASKKQCVWGRLLAGERAFQGSVSLIEGTMMNLDFMFEKLGVERIFSHPVAKNTASVRLNKRYGFVENTGAVEYPEELLVANDPMIELVLDKAAYQKAKTKISRMLGDLL